MLAHIYFKKKSQIFLFDLILALVIIIISLGILFSNFIVTSSNANIYNLNRDITNAIFETKINSLNDPYVRSLFTQNMVKNIENTVAQQIGEFYVTSLNEDRDNLTRFFVESFVDNNININITLINDTSTYELYSRVLPGAQDIESSILVAYSQRSFIGFLNQSSIYGPFEIGVKLWV